MKNDSTQRSTGANGTSIKVLSSVFQAVEALGAGKLGWGVATTGAVVPGTTGTCTIDSTLQTVPARGAWNAIILGLATTHIRIEGFRRTIDGSRDCFRTILSRRTGILLKVRESIHPCGTKHPLRALVQSVDLLRRGSIIRAIEASRTLRTGVCARGGVGSSKAYGGIDGGITTNVSRRTSHAQLILRDSGRPCTLRVLNL